MVKQRLVGEVSREGNIPKEPEWVGLSWVELGCVVVMAESEL